MSRRKTALKRQRAQDDPAAKRSGKGPAAATASEAHSRLPSAAAIREIVESIVVAFVLAFLFRTFEAEAFVIPTGSMAPTLMGRHKDLVCPICGCPYRVGASEELDQETEGDKGPDFAVAACICPMCRYLAEVPYRDTREELVNTSDYTTGQPSYNGDRLLVDKLAYEFIEPKRWDVVVFRYPNAAWRNYIKRLVGLPGESIRIQYGNVWIDGDHMRGNRR